jgi:hypothetical protein
MRHALLMALLTTALTATGGTAPPPLYALLPSDYPGPLIRVCHTDYGICLLPFTIQPGAPCACMAAGGVWVRGVTVH